MPDQRQHRGPHPEDRRLFSGERLPRLRAATCDLSWLLSRGYAVRSATKLVGDRYTLEARQRIAVVRCAGSDAAKADRRHKTVTPDQLRGRELWLDGYNVLTTVEAALSGGVILLARDGCYRDMASVHGSYRKVQETLPAIRLVGESLEAVGLARGKWFLDQPVSNSGRLKSLLQRVAESSGWDWIVEVVNDPDYILSRTEHIVASSDSQILDNALRWFNLARHVVDERVPMAWIADLQFDHWQAGQS